MVVTINKKLAKVSTTIKSPDGSETTEEDFIEVPAKVTGDSNGFIQATAMGLVGMEMSNTVNMGNYNSIRVQVSIGVPYVSTDCEAGPNAAFDFGYKWVGEKMAIVLNDIADEVG